MSRESTGRPRSRAPHVWLGDGTSALDLFGRAFVLLAGPDGGPWCNAARIAGRVLGLHVDAHEIGSGRLAGATDEVTRAYGITSSGAVLVRPDGFVCWRERQLGPDPTEWAPAISRVLGAITGRKDLT